MFYTISDCVVKKAGEDVKNINRDIPLIGYLDYDLFCQNATKLGFDNEDIIEYNLDNQKRFHTGIEVYDDFSVVTLILRNLTTPEMTSDKVILILKSKLLLVINIDDKDGSTMHALESSMRHFHRNATLEKILSGMLEMLISTGSHTLEEYQEFIMKMEGRITSNKSKDNLNGEIYKMRNRLSVMHNFYEQVADIAETLNINENAIFEESDLRYMRILESKAERLSRSTQEISENLIHLREALTAAANETMNKTMRILTVVSVIFLPLTLITGWYGMNFAVMPELQWEYGYAGVFILCAVVLVVCLVWFHKKKWL